MWDDNQTQMKYIKPVLFGIASGIVYLLISGIITALIPNPWFTRMIGSAFIDYFYLYSISLLIGLYVIIHVHKKNSITSCKRIAVGSGATGFFAFSCPICNQVLVLLFGSTLLMQYFDPLRPILGAISITLLILAIWWRLKN